MPLIVESLPLFETNYAHMLLDPAGGRCAAVDPADALSVAGWLDRRGLTLSAILNTHHHSDHTGGNIALKERYGATVYGAEGDASRIPGIDVGLTDGTCFELFGCVVTVLETPGHTSGAICFSVDDMLFTGDTLFAMGCGRLFEGDAATMLTSLSKIAVLPDETKIYPGHNYALADARFAITLEPVNAALQQRLLAAEQGLIGAGFLLGEEKETNPFLRANTAALRASLAGDDKVWLTAPAGAVLGEVRNRKDRF